MTLVIWLGLALGPGAVEAPPEMVRLVGSVVDPGGAPIAGAEVLASSTSR